MASILEDKEGYRGGSPTAIQAWQPALCGSRPHISVD